MSTKDPFLNSLIAWLDRLSAWLAASVVITGVLWFLVWQRFLYFSGSDTWRFFISFVTGKADTVSMTIGVLIVCIGIETSTVVSLWLFASWRRKGELSAEHIRGSKLKD